MIQHVWERCCLAESPNNVFVATDDEKISNTCKAFGANVIMTSSNCLTGTDRLAEANLTLKKDFLINVQGDEPLINPDDIRDIISVYQKNPGTVINAMCKIKSAKDHNSLTVPKVTSSKSGQLLYMSRAPIPLTKSGEFVSAFKQVCIYAFSSEHLRFFSSLQEKTPLEKIEDIEILRFLENDIPVKIVEVVSTSLTIDVESDVPAVLALLNKQ